MECKNARLLLDYARPRGTDLGLDETAALEGHLAECMECGSVAREERRLDEHLGQAMRAVAVPEGLQARTLGRLAVERDRWYRQWLVRCGGILGAAAAIVLLIWGGVIWRNGPSHLEIDEAIRALADKSTATPEKVQEWFQRAHHVRTFAPSDKEFDYRWLASYQMEDFAGRRVPALLFTYNDLRTQDWAKVFIVSQKDFSNLEQLANQQAEGSGGYKAMVIQNRERPDVYYIFVYRDSSDRRFLIRCSPVT
jgi:hypothetical protein